MATIDVIKECILQGKTGFSLGFPDENGISKTALNDSMVLYIVASPQGPTAENELDCIFAYAPLLSLRGLPDGAYKKLFFEVGKYGLPSNMSPGMRFGFEESSEILWICQRVVGSVLTVHSVSDGLQRFVNEALRLQPLLINFVEKLSTEFAHSTRAEAVTSHNEVYADTYEQSYASPQQQTYQESYQNPYQAPYQENYANNVGAGNGTFNATVDDAEITSLQLMQMGFALRV